ncbi:MAG: hypothetical protein ACYCX4_15575 [Bacillota bacterium]
MFILKWGAYAAAIGLIFKNIDILGLLAAMCGSFMVMFGVQKGGQWIKTIMAIYLLIKIYMGVA